MLFSETNVETIELIEQIRNAKDVSYFFEHYEENEIIASIKDDNIPSLKTAESAGFKLLETRMYKDIYDEEEELYRFYYRRGMKQGMGV